MTAAGRCLISALFEGTERTRSGGQVGIEIETDFVTESGDPIDIETSRAILQERAGRPDGCQHQLELGRQKIELAVGPCTDIAELLERTRRGLTWLYGVAGRHGALPRYAPDFACDDSLLLIGNERDRLWSEIDGNEALEALCRCSSVQFTVDVHPGDAIHWINALWSAGLQSRDYAWNDGCWRRYLARSRAAHAPSRYAGPQGFESIADYAEQLVRHPVLMHAGTRVCAPFGEHDLDLYLRSSWWHYRLRRFADTLALEIRPIARRSDDALSGQWRRVANVLGVR